MLVGAYLRYGLQSQSPTDPNFYAYVGMDCNPTAQGTHGLLQQQQNESTPIPTTQKRNAIFFFGVMPYAKMGSAKKIAKIEYFLLILDAVGNILLIINSKHPKIRIPRIFRICTVADIRFRKVTTEVV